MSTPPWSTKIRKYIFFNFTPFEHCALHCWELLKMCWESTEKLLRICWEPLRNAENVLRKLRSAENMLRNCWKFTEKVLRIYCELLRRSWVSTEYLLRTCWESAENWENPEYLLRYYFGANDPTFPMVNFMINLTLLSQWSTLWSIWPYFPNVQLYNQMRLILVMRAWLNSSWLIKLKILWPHSWAQELKILAGFNNSK